jgi:hypothetical protein
MKKLILLSLLAACGGTSTAPSEGPAFAEGDLPALHMGDVVLHPYGSVPPIGSEGWYFASYGGRVHDADHNLVAGAVIKMDLESNVRSYTIPSACTTFAFASGDTSCANAGSFKIGKRERRKSITLTLSILGVEKAGYGYDPSLNHDDTGGSDGTTHAVVIR